MFKSSPLKTALTDSLTLEAALQTHCFDHMTNYCTACGQAKLHIEARRMHCFGSDRIVGISHIRAAIRTEEIITAVEQRQRTEADARAVSEFLPNGLSDFLPPSA